MAKGVTGCKKCLSGVILKKLKKVKIKKWGGAHVEAVEDPCRCRS
jgi:hypothetical protein